LNNFYFSKRLLLRIKTVLVKEQLQLIKCLKFITAAIVIAQYKKGAALLPLKLLAVKLVALNYTEAAISC
jgi:hypothetical protein